MGLLDFLLPFRAFSYKIGDIDLKFRTGVSEEYNDNISQNSVNAKSDAITNLKFGLNAFYEGKTQNLNFSGDIIRHIFSQNPKLSNTTEEFGLRYNKEFSRRGRLSLTEAFLHSEEPTSFEDEFGRTSGRYSYTRNRFNSSYTHDLSKQITLSLNYGNETIEYSRVNPADTFTNNAGFEAAYAISSADILYAIYGFTVKKYAHGSAFKTNRLSGGWRHYFTSQLYLDALAGQDFIKSSHLNRAKTENYISTSLTDEFDQTTKGVLSFLKEGGANSDTQDIRESWRVSLDLTKQLFARLNAGLSGFFGEGKFSSSGTNDKLKGANIGLAYEISKSWKSNLSYSLSNLTSNVSTREYTVNRISLGATYEF